MDALNDQRKVAEDEIKVVLGQLAAVERKLDEPDADIAYLRKEKDQLRDEMKQLREKERLILELILRQTPGK
jgi:septal ring factor EnvC (AmiA/AmiB activator)